MPDEDYTTIGGFVFGALGRLPVVGDRVTAGDAVFTVREMDGRRIESLAVDLHSVGDGGRSSRAERPSALTGSATPAREALRAVSVVPDSHSASRRHAS